MKSIEEMMDSLRDKANFMGVVEMPLSMIESYLKLAYSCGKVDALQEFKADLPRDIRNA